MDEDKDKTVETRARSFGVGGRGRQQGRGGWMSASVRGTGSLLLAACCFLVGLGLYHDVRKSQTFLAAIKNARQQDYDSKTPATFAKAAGPVSTMFLLPSTRDQPGSSSGPERNTTEQPPKKRIGWNSTELKNWLEVKNMKPWNKTLVMSEKVMDFVPRPQGTDVEIYNLDAWHRLRVLLGVEEGKEEQGVTHSSSNTVILCSTGGSSTAGGGNIPKMDRYDEVFAAMIRTRTTKHTQDGNMEIPRKLDLSVVNSGHGDRGSLHSALFMHSFIPADTDVIIWEFAINDFMHDFQRQGCEIINSVFVIWLDKVARHSSPPPLVLLVYLYDGMKPNKDGRIGLKLFECHGGIAATYDFVVGSVNLASYLNSLFDFSDAKKHFVADSHHPNQMGHLFVANLLWDLVVNDKRPNKTSGGLLSRPQPHWSCERDSPTKKLILYLLEKKHTFASWSSEFPRNQDGDNGGMLSPQIFAGASVRNSSNFTYELNGKASEFRQDRKYSITLPLCATGERLGFDLSSTSGVMAKSHDVTEDGRKFMSACLMYFPEINHGIPSIEWLKLRQDIMVEIFDAEGAIIELGAYNNSRPEFYLVNRPRDPCLRSIGGPWLLFPNKTLVSRITFCNRYGSGKNYSIESLAIF